MIDTITDCSIKPGPDGNYAFKVNNRNTRERCSVCLKLTVKTPCSSVSIINLEQVNSGWVGKVKLGENRDSF